MYQTLLPLNATQGEQALEQVMGHISDLPIDIRTVKNPDLCPLELLPWLAWEYAITYWDENWTEAQKRSVIKNAPAVNKTRGTPGAVKQALAAIDRQIDLIEWFNDSPQGDPYTFRAVVHGESVTSDELRRIVSQICDAKNARSWLGGIRVGPQQARGQFFIGGGIYARQSVTINAKKRDE